MYGLLLEGRSAADAVVVAQTDTIGDELLGEWAAAAERLIARFREPGSMARIVHHPAGDCAGETLAVMQVTEFTVHGWDLARAVGTDENLDTDVVDWLLLKLSPMMPSFETSGFFGAPSGQFGDDQSSQVRLLDLLGRRP